ncbi:spore germination protein [Paenibacillus luteus]|uniref:spore germination protein n=1 Tax=Paenibacillus luteus TaxID=2545753 RepID=UPI0011447AE9|nr:spore germination protein [Paenibacillus luteus]
MTQFTIGEGVEHVPADLEAFTNHLHGALSDSPDIVYRSIVIGGNKGVIVYIEGLADPRLVLESIHDESPLWSESTGSTAVEDNYTRLQEHAISEGKVEEAHLLGLVISALLSGNTIIYLEGMSSALLVGTENLKQRAVQEASSQSVVRGPREGFTESLRDNTSLVRRRIQNPKLRLQEHTMGEESRTKVAIMFMEGKVDPDVLLELNKRLKHISLESILESNYIEEMIQDQRYSPFPTVYNTERPDIIAAALLDGRIAIFVEGTPFVLVVPALFLHFFQSSEDYYQRGDFASLVRFLRYICFAIALLTPSFYIAITTFHQEMIPANLLMSLIGQREGIPFPAFIEALLMEVTFEILREAGIRLPKSIGQSVSIVGTLVIGQAAVEAGLISAAMVIVVSITAIANFALPTFNMGISVRMLRFVLMAITASFGLFGMSIALIMLALHLCNLQSMGIPYMTSFAPFRWSDQKDALLRLSRPVMNKYFGRSGKKDY